MRVRMKNLGNKIFDGLSNNSFGINIDEFYINIDEFYCTKRWEVHVQDGVGTQILTASNCNDESLDCNITIPDISTTPPPPQTTPTPPVSTSFTASTPYFKDRDPFDIRTNFSTFMILIDKQKYVDYAVDNGITFLLFRSQTISDSNNMVLGFGACGPINPNLSGQEVLVGFGGIGFIDGETYTIVIEDVFGETYSVKYVHRD